MHLERDLIHPELFRATDQFSSGVWMTGGAGVPPEQMKAFTAHSNLWWRDNWKKATAWFVGWFVAIIGGGALVKTYLGKPWTAIFILLFMALTVFVSIAAYNRERRRLTAEELDTMLPMLDLTPIQRAYAEALVAMGDVAFPADQRREILTQLNRLLDEEARLRSIRQTGASHAAAQDEIAKERDEIIAKLDRTQDRVTRDALTRGLEICDRRLAAAADLSQTEERVDAQLEMIAQAIRGVRDSLHRLKSAPSASLADLNLEELDNSVSLAHRHTDSLESAVAEVRAIG